STEKKFSLVDTTIPKVEEVSMEGNRVILVKFSEYVDPGAVKTPSNYRLDGVNLSSYGASSSSIDWNAKKNEARITLTNPLADKTYKLMVSVDNNITDAAGLKLVQVEKDLTVKTDTTVAKLNKVEVNKNEGYVDIEF